jgi:hypothetical protein
MRLARLPRFETAAAMAVMAAPTMTPAFSPTRFVSQMRSIDV